MLEYDIIDISDGININKTNASKESDICDYCYFLDKNFNYEPYLCNGCHDLMQKVEKVLKVLIMLLLSLLKVMKNPFLVYEQK